MKNIKLFIILNILIFGILYPFAGHIEENTTWEEDIVITGDTWVDEDVILTIMPGVTVYFLKVDDNLDGIGDVDFIISGKLVCHGTEYSRITFTSNEENPQPSDWGGIDYETAGGNIYESSDFSYTDMLFAHQALYVNGRNVTLYRCNIRNTGDYGIRIERTLYPTSISDSQINECQTYGLLLEEGSLVLLNSVVFDNGTFGVKLEEQAEFYSDDLVIGTNGETGIWIVGAQDVLIENSRMINNAHCGILIDGSSPSFINTISSNNDWSGIFIRQESSNPTFTNCTIDDNSHAGFLINQGSATVEYSTVLRNGGPGIWVFDGDPTFNYNNIYYNEGSNQALYNDDFIGIAGRTYLETFESNEWRENGEGSVSHPEESFTHPRKVLNITYKKDGNEYCGCVRFHHVCGEGWTSWDYRNYSKISFNGLDFAVNEFNQTVNNNTGPSCGGGSLPEGFDCVQCFFVNGGTHPDYYRAYDMSEQTVSGEINQWVWSNLDVYLSIYHDYNCPGSTAFVTEYSYQPPYSPENYQTIILNAAETNIDFEHNWWSITEGVDSLIYEENTGTIAFDIMQQEPVSGAGANLPNIEPSFVLTSPSEMLINPEYVTINWSALDLDDNAVIHLYYDDGEDTSGTLIVGPIYEDDGIYTYEWDVTEVPFGLYNVFGIIDDGGNDPIVSFAPAQILVGSLTVSAPENFIGGAGTEAVVPIEVMNSIGYFGIISFQFTLAYDSTLISATGVSTDSTLTHNWSVFTNTNTAGQISVNGFTTEPLSISGTLLNIVFDVSEDGNNYDTSPLVFTDFVFNEGIDNLVVEDGVLTVLIPYYISGFVGYYSNNEIMAGVTLSLTGDSQSTTISAEDGSYSFANFNGSYMVTPSYNAYIPEMVITPYDASLTAQYSLDLYIFDINQQAAADVSGDGSATVFDAALMAQYSVGLINDFPAGRWLFDPTYTSYYELEADIDEQQYFGIVVGDPSGNWYPDSSLRIEGNQSSELIVSAYEGEEIYIPITSVDEFQSVLIDLEFSSEFSFVRIEKDLSVLEFVEFENAEDTRYQFGSFSTAPVSADNPYTVVLVSNETVENAILYAEILFDEQSSTTALDVSSDNRIVPGKFTLSQNYPNPFNPVTNFQFTMAASGEHSIIIFNLSGGEVKTISSGWKEIGRYSVTLDASDYPSGVYFAKFISEGEIKDMKKMILLK